MDTCEGKKENNWSRVKFFTHIHVKGKILKYVKKNKKTKKKTEQNKTSARFTISSHRSADIHLIASAYFLLSHIKHYCN